MTDKNFYIENSTITLNVGCNEPDSGSVVTESNIYTYADLSQLEPPLLDDVFNKNISDCALLIGEHMRENSVFCMWVTKEIFPNLYNAMPEYKPSTLLPSIKCNLLTLQKTTRVLKVKAEFIDTEGRSISDTPLPNMGYDRYFIGASYKHGSNKNYLYLRLVGDGSILYSNSFHYSSSEVQSSDGDVTTIEGITLANYDPYPLEIEKEGNKYVRTIQISKALFYERIITQFSGVLSFQSEEFSGKTDFFEIVNIKDLQALGNGYYYTIIPIYQTIIGEDANKNLAIRKIPIQFWLNGDYVYIGLQSDMAGLTFDSFNIELRAGH